MTRILLLGAQGQVGQELQRSLAPLGSVRAVSRSDLDLTQASALRTLLQQEAPAVIVNAAAYTAVDRAETETTLAEQVNSQLPRILAEESQSLGAYLIHLSTDYVFDGRKNTPYLETDGPNPLGVYGKTKLVGEQAIQQIGGDRLILRTAWVYGIYGKGNFVKTMVRLGKERDTLRVVVDQVGSPTWAQDIAQAIAVLLPQRAQGVYHLTNSGVASWYDFAVAIFSEARQLGIPLQVKEVLPITSQEFPTPAPRPAYSVLSGQKVSAALGYPLPHWRESLVRMLRAGQRSGLF